MLLEHLWILEFSKISLGAFIKMASSSEVDFSWSLLLQIFNNDFSQNMEWEQGPHRFHNMGDNITQGGFCFCFIIDKKKGISLNLLPPLIIALWKVKWFWYCHVIFNYIDFQLKGVFSSLSSFPPSSSSPLSLPFLFFEEKNWEVVSMEWYNQKWQLTWGSVLFFLQIHSQKIGKLVIFLLIVNGICTLNLWFQVSKYIGITLVNHLNFHAKCLNVIWYRDLFH